MDSVIGVVFFLVIIFVFNAVRKYQENQQRAQRESEPKLRQEDLPEATRRMLYGGEGPAPADEPAEAPVAEPAPMARRVETPPRREPMSPMVPRQVPQRREIPEFPEAWADESEARRAARVAMQAALQRKLECVQPRKAPQAGARVVPAPAPGAGAVSRPARKARRMAGLFCNLDAVRKGVIMHEILGPPRSLRDG